MIYDGHAYCFPDLRGDGGFADPQQFRRHLQLSIGRHFQPAWRKRDRAPADNSGTVDPSGGWSFHDLREGSFRPTSHGRFEWMVGGEGYVKQYMPPSVVDMAYSAEALVAEMDYAGVDKALVHRTPYLGISNEFVADCVRAFPDRLQGLAYVEEWTVRPDPDAAIAKLDRSINELGLAGLQVLSDNLPLYGQSEDLNAPAFTPFWEALSKLKVPLFVTPSYSSLASVGSPVEGLTSQLKMLRTWMDSYPDVDVVFTHGLSWRMFIDGGGLAIPDEVFDAAPVENPRFHMQLLFPIFLGGIWDYPMIQVRPTMEVLVDRFGPDRLIWGTDMPIVMRFYTYRQCLDHMRACADFLAAADLDLILGGNMARLMGVEGRAA